MHIGEEAARQGAIPSHHVEQARYAGVGGEPGGEYRYCGADQHDRLEQLATDIEGDLRQHRIRMLEAGDVREEELQEVGGGDKQHTADQRRQHDGAGDNPIRVRGLFRQGADGIKAEERQTEDRGPHQQRRDVDLLGEEGPAAGHGTQPLAIVHAPGDQADKDGDDAELHDDDDAVEVGHQLDAAQVEGGHHRRQTEDIGPGLYVREERLQIDLGQQHVDHRHEHIVEQGGPAHHKADIGVEHLLGIGIGGACRRELAHQMAVAQGGEQHADQGKEVGGRDMAFGDLGNDAEGVEHCHGGEVGKTHDHDLPQFQGLFQTNRLGVHHACSSRGAGAAHSINETGKEARESRAPGWRAPGRAGRKALRCPMLFLTECGVGRLLPISLSFPGVIRPRLWVCSLYKKGPARCGNTGPCSGGALCICRAPLTRKKGGKTAFFCTG